MGMQCCLPVQVSNEGPNCGSARAVKQEGQGEPKRGIDKGNSPRWVPEVSRQVNP